MTIFNKDLERRIHNLEIMVKELQPLLDRERKSQKSLHTKILKYISKNFNSISKVKKNCVYGFYDKNIKIYKGLLGGEDYTGEYCSERLPEEWAKEFYYLLQELKQDD